MRFESEAHYWVHVITHYADALIHIRKTYNIREGDGRQEVRLAS